MKLYRIKNTVTGKFYRHKYSQFRGGDWVDADKATVWTKHGGAGGALGALREKYPQDSFVIETATIDNVEWK